MSRGELLEWQAFYELEPFGPAREDLRAGTIAAMLSSNGATPGTFFPNLKAEGDPGGTSMLDMSPEEQAAMLVRTLGVGRAS